MINTLLVIIFPSKRSHIYIYTRTYDRYSSEKDYFINRRKHIMCLWSSWFDCSAHVMNLQMSYCRNFLTLRLLIVFFASRGAILETGESEVIWKVNFNAAAKTNTVSDRFVVDDLTRSQFARSLQRTLSAYA